MKSVAIHVSSTHKCPGARLIREVLHIDGMKAEGSTHIPQASQTGGMDGGLLGPVSSA